MRKVYVAVKGKKIVFIFPLGFTKTEAQRALAIGETLSRAVITLV